MRRPTDTELADAKLAEALTWLLIEFPYHEDSPHSLLGDAIDAVSEARSILAKRILRTETARKAKASPVRPLTDGETVLW